MPWIIQGKKSWYLSTVGCNNSQNHVLNTSSSSGTKQAHVALESAKRAHQNKQNVEVTQAANLQVPSASQKEI